MNQFTKGPWNISGNQIEFDHRVQVCCGNGSAVGCCGEPVPYGDAGSICECNDPVNAKLIAAAPDLFEALRDVIGWVPSCYWLTDEPFKSVERARAALSKATA